MSLKIDRKSHVIVTKATDGLCHFILLQSTRTIAIKLEEHTLQAGEGEEMEEERINSEF